MAVVALEASEVRQHLDTQTVVLTNLEAEIKKYNNTLTADQAKVSSFFLMIRQKQDTISNYKQKINDIAAITGVRKVLFFSTNTPFRAYNKVVVVNKYNLTSQSKSNCVL